MAKARTIRIEGGLDEAIERIAKNERVSVNLVVNRALRRFVSWDKAFATRGMVSVPSKLLTRLMNDRRPEEARSLGRWAGLQLFVPNMKAQYPTVTVDVAVRGMSMLSSYGGRFEFDHKLSGKTHTILIRHSLGRNWSAYYAGTLEGIFGEYLGKTVKLRVTEDLCICQFEE